MRASYSVLLICVWIWVVLIADLGWNWRNHRQTSRPGRQSPRCTQIIGRPCRGNYWNLLACSCPCFTCFACYSWGSTCSAWNRFHCLGPFPVQPCNFVISFRTIYLAAGPPLTIEAFFSEVREPPTSASIIFLVAVLVPLFLAAAWSTAFFFAVSALRTSLATPMAVLWTLQLGC